MSVFFAERALLPTGWAENVRIEVGADGLLTRVQADASAEGAERLAGPLLLILLGQLVVVVIYGGLLVYRAVGRDYESAVMSAAFCGFAMGATATAIANMQAITQRYGPSPQAFMVVPLVGAFLIDLLNAVVLTGYLSLPWMGA